MKNSLFPTFLTFLFFLGAIFNRLDAQVINDSLLTLKVTLSKVQVSDVEDMNLKIVIRNISRKKAQVYQYLAEGYDGDNSKNLNLIVEKEDNGKYKTYDLRSRYQMAPGRDSDYVPKINVSSNDSVVFYYHVSNSYAFSSGKYRLKCIYNNSMLKEDFVTSNWIYFRVTKYIPTKHYFNELLQKAIWPVIKDDSVK